jgi:NADPH:quinone reductase-like Zn-dependent oxidoreductase
VRAVGFSRYGGPEVLELLDLPEVHAGPGQVRIRNHAATVNPTDLLFRDGTLRDQHVGIAPPYVPGMEAAGIVDEVGEDVATGIRIGDRVIGIVVPRGDHGAYREQLVLDAKSVARAPAGRSHAEACTLPMNGLAARRSLDLLALAPGQTLAVTGAAGAYGGYIIQLAKAEGLTVIADASEADAPRIRAHFPDGVDGLADAAVLNERAIPAVRDGGAFTSLRGFQGEPQRGIRFTTTFVAQYEGRCDLLDRLRRQVEDGTLTLRMVATYPMERASEAHRRLESGGTRGRLVIEI